MKLLKWVFVALLLLGGFLFDHAVNLISHSSSFGVEMKLEYIISLFLGLLFGGVSLSYFCLAFGLLDVVSCVVFVFTLVMMPVFELVMGAEMVYWVFFICIPSVLYVVYRKTKWKTILLTLIIIVMTLLILAVFTYMSYEFHKFLN